MERLLPLTHLDFRTLNPIIYAEILPQPVIFNYAKNIITVKVAAITVCNL